MDMATHINQQVLAEVPTSFVAYATYVQYIHRYIHLRGHHHPYSLSPDRLYIYPTTIQSTFLLLYSVYKPPTKPHHIIEYMSNAIPSVWAVYIFFIFFLYFFFLYFSNFSYGRKNGN